MHVSKSAVLVLLAGQLLILGACIGSKKSAANQKPVHPVRGQLLVGGKPAAGAFVFFIPVNEPSDPTDPLPRAEVAPDATFNVSIYGAKGGATMGVYIVTILWEGEGGLYLLQGQYADGRKSALRACVR